MLYSRKLAMRQSVLGVSKGPMDKKEGWGRKKTHNLLEQQSSSLIAQQTSDHASYS